MELFLIAIALSMDCVAVSLVNSASGIHAMQILKMSFLFGFFQAAMPVIGYFFGLGFARFVESIDHFVAFFILGFLGLKMIKESREKVESNLNLSLKMLILASIATSIDTLAVGVTLSFSDENIVFAALVIGLTCFALSVGASLVGKKIGLILQNKALILGGVILILIGCKILITHLFFSE